VPHLKKGKACLVVQSWYCSGRLEQMCYNLSVLSGLPVMSYDKGVIVLLTTALQSQNVWFYIIDEKS